MFPSGMVETLRLHVCCFEGEPVFLKYLDEFLVGDGSEPRHLFEVQAQVVKGYEFRRAPGLSFELVTSLFKHFVEGAHLLACF